ncbi:glycosyltransferase family 2 protein [Microlunatus parietis]|uniref:GT2 family glycosyltransferase n=1 Tax=Microlunatus parietis TaxID=682979 RepID=A0A7Y9IAH8_9ACTN|nr:glycosyltransferase [Microlunatus parietis]NYE72996.1 GT2 family glycosyltransferase [Microlunatus parietis]
MKITVGILTFRRPESLARSLPVVLDQLGRNPDLDAEVLVVDNDPAGSARAITESVPGKALRYLVEPEPGIAAARNRVLAETTGSRLLIFLDDDEVPEPGWFDALLRTWRAAGRPAAVMGRVQSVFDHDVDPWVAAGEFFRRRRMPSGTELDAAAAGNLLLDLDQVRRTGVRFDPGLGLGGGEDTLFTRQLHAAGGRIVWCDESVAVDTVPAGRTTRRWVKARSWSQGNNQVAVELRLARGPLGRALVRARAVLGGAVRVSGGMARAFAGVMTRSLRHRARGIRTACRGGGMIAGALGARYREYARDA